MTELSASQLRNFLRAVNSLKPKSRTARLRMFIERTRPLRPTRRASGLTARVPAVRAVAQAASAHVERRRQSGADINVWQVAGLGHDEVRVSSVLAWFLSPTATHGAGGKFANAFWSAAGGPSLGFDLSSLRRVAVEVCPLADNSDRVDLALEGDEFLVFIEVKIRAGLQPDQLSRYEVAARRLGSGLIYVMRLI